MNSAKHFLPLMMILATASVVHAQRDPLIGKKAPDIVLKNLQGEQQKLSELEGKVVLIDFWAGWCKPCIADIQEWLKPMYGEYKDKGFEVFAVSFDNTEEAWQRAVERYDLQWEHVWDFGEKQAFRAYQVYQIPTSYLVDKNGVIVAKDLKRTRLSREVDRLLEE